MFIKSSQEMMQGKKLVDIIDLALINVLFYFHTRLAR